MLKPKWKSIGYCTGCQKPCFLNDVPNYWELGTMCRCEAKLNRGHPVFNLQKVGFTFILVLAIFLTNDPLLKLIELFFLGCAVSMIVWHLESWLIVKLTDGHHPSQYDLRAIYLISPDKFEVVAVNYYEGIK